MVKSIFKTKGTYNWMLFHLALGILATLSKYFFITWIYLFFFFIINKLISDLIYRKSTKYVVISLGYICSFEVFGRMVKAYPYIPWEVSKYLIFLVSVLILLIFKFKIKDYIGVLLIFLLIPGVIIDKSNMVNLSISAFNLLGLIGMALLIIIINYEKINIDEFDMFIRLIWYSTITLLVYVVIKTPDYSTIKFSLSAIHDTTGGFGSNQVATILGLGMFLSFYAWMNKLLFSGNHTLDGIFIGLFAYQGFLTFSRGGIFVGILAMICYSILLRKSKHYNKLIKLKSLNPLFYFSFSIFILFFSYSLINNITDGTIGLRYLGETGSTLSGQNIKTLNTITTGRADIIIADLKIWYDNFIFGVGVGGSKYFRENNVLNHTELSRLLAEHGLFGLLFFLVLFYSSFKKYFDNSNYMCKEILIILFLIGISTSMHSSMRTFITPLLISISMLRIKKTEII
jgi:hypothetical protein